MHPWRKVIHSRSSFYLRIAHHAEKFGSPSGSIRIWCHLGMDQYLLIPCLGGWNILLPAILMFTRGTRFWHTAIWCFQLTEGRLSVADTEAPWLGHQCPWPRPCNWFRSAEMFFGLKTGRPTIPMEKWSKMVIWRVYYGILWYTGYSPLSNKLNIQCCHEDFQWLRIDRGNGSNKIIETARRRDSWDRWHQCSSWTTWSLSWLT